jgi:hypothetical protein
MYSKEAGRDVMTDLRPWQLQAMKGARTFAVRQGFRRRHPAKLLSNYAADTFNGGGPNGPRTKYEQAMQRSQDLTQIPEYYAPVNKDQRIANQLGLVDTAYKNYMKSRQRMSMSTPVGV